VSSPETSRRTRARSLLQGAALVAGLVFLAWLVWRAVSQGAFDVATIHWPATLLALALCCVATTSVARLMYSRYRLHGSTVAAPLLARAFYYGQIAKYIPGKIAGLWFQAATLKQPGAGHITLMSNIELTVLGMIANASVGAALVTALRWPVVAVLIVIAGFALTYAAGTARWTAHLAARAMQTVGMHVPRTDHDAPDTRRAIAWFYVANALVMIPAMALLLWATLGVDVATASGYVAISLLAWVVSSAAMIFPAGLGVREAAFIAIGHAAGVPASTATLGAAAVLLRLLQIAQDVLCAAIFAIVDRRRRTREAGESAE
jgi:glycosyltransferase 2 family protein